MKSFPNESIILARDITYFEEVNFFQTIKNNMD